MSIYTYVCMYVDIPVYAYVFHNQPVFIIRTRTIAYLHANSAMAINYLISVNSHTKLFVVELRNS